MSFTEKFNALARRGKALTRLERELGSFDQATWAMESLATYLEHGGTLGGLHILIGEDVDRELQELGEQPPPGEDPRPIGLVDSLDTDAGQAQADIDAGKYDPVPASRRDLHQVGEDVRVTWLGSHPDQLTLEEDGRSAALHVLDGRQAGEVFEDPEARIHRVMADGDLLRDDQPELERYFDHRVPSYARRITAVGVLEDPALLHATRFWLVALVADRGDTERIN